MEVVQQVLAEIQAWWPTAPAESKQTVYILAGFLGLQVVLDLINRFLNPVRIGGIE